MKALHELVPSSNKTDKASMLDEIIDYVKFRQLQVKVLSVSRLGGASAVAPLVADPPAEGRSYLAAALHSQCAFLAQDAMIATEQKVAGLMEKDMAKAMQFLLSNGLCLMPISLATARPEAGSEVDHALFGAGQLQMGPLSTYVTRATNSMP